MVGEFSRTDDWWIVAIALVLAYFLVYPLYVLYMRFRNARRIKQSIVTSPYKQPLELTPAEMSYLFTSRVRQKQMYGTLLHLANRSIIHLEKKEGVIVASVGPKVEKKLKTYEKFLLLQITNSKRPIPVDQLMRGNTRFKTISDGEVKGSKQYVFWWLLRRQLQDSEHIRSRMIRRYSKMLLLFGVLGSLLVSVVPLLCIRLFQMLRDGEIEFDSLTDSLLHAVQFWAIVVLFFVVVSFFLLKFRGWMLGREWVMSQDMLRYLGQAVSFREFVRLTHKGQLRFESKQLEKESRTNTKPFAIAFGYAKE